MMRETRRPDGCTSGRSKTPAQPAEMWKELLREFYQKNRKT